MKFFSKLVKSASAFVAAAAIVFSGSVAFADGVKVWNRGRALSDYPNVFLKKVKTAPGDPEKYVVKENPGASVRGYLEVVDSNTWKYKSVSRTVYTIKKLSETNYSMSFRAPSFTDDASGGDLEKRGSEWVLKDRGKDIWKISEDLKNSTGSSKKYKVINCAISQPIKTVENVNLSNDVMLAMTMLTRGCIG